MNDRATPTGRSERMRRTRITVMELGRKLTAERGLSGFTVDELCAEAGISRRTFFNYFPSKEDAIIGQQSDAFADELIERFLGPGAEPAPDRAPLIDALVELSVASMDEFFQITGSITSLHPIVQREPEFLARVLRESEGQHRFFLDLIERREGLPPGDPRAQFALELVGAVVHRAAIEFFADSAAAAAAGSIGPLMHARLAEARALFAPPHGG